MESGIKDSGCLLVRADHALNMFQGKAGKHAPRVSEPLQAESVDQLRNHVREKAATSRHGQPRPGAPSCSADFLETLALAGSTRHNATHFLTILLYGSSHPNPVIELTLV